MRVGGAGRHVGEDTVASFAVRLLAQPYPFEREADEQDVQFASDES